MSVWCSKVWFFWELSLIFRPKLLFGWKQYYNCEFSFLVFFFFAKLISSYLTEKKTTMSSRSPFPKMWNECFELFVWVYADIQGDKEVSFIQNPNAFGALQQLWCQRSDWQNGLSIFFGCFGSGGSGGGSKPWQRAATHSRNLPTNPCLWLGLWRCMSLLDVSCQLALGTLDFILSVQSLCSNCLGWCRTY